MSFAARSIPLYGSDPYPNASVALDFVRGYFKAPGASGGSLSAIPGFSYSRTGTEYAQTSSGLLVPFGSGVPAVTDLGLQVWEARTNKNTNTNVNPQSTTNAVKGGDAAATLTVVDDTAKLASIGLSGNVFKLDNSAGAGLAWATLGGLTGNTNAHSMSAWVRGSATGATLEYNGGSGGTSFTPATNYTRIKGENKTSPATTAQMVVTVNAGGVVFFIGNNFEEAAFAGPLIPVSGASATRGAASASVGGLSVPNSAFTLFVSATLPAGDGIERDLISLGADSNNVVNINRDSSNRLNALVRIASVQQYNALVAGFTGAQTIKAAVAFDGTQYWISYNGIEAAGSGTGKSAPPLSTLRVGDWIASGAPVDGVVSRAVFYPSFLSTAQRAALTQ